VKIAIALLAGAGALFTGSANAADFYTTSEYLDSNVPVVQPIRTVCDEDGRCYRTHGGSRVMVRDSYDYAPRERYIERRDYRDRDDGPRTGVGIRAPRCECRGRRRRRPLVSRQTRRVRKQKKNGILAASE
jgi:hypothetical protein